jgi:hypothetical protein
MKKHFLSLLGLIFFGHVVQAQITIKTLGTSKGGASNAFSNRSSLAVYPGLNLVGWAHRAYSSANTIKVDLSVDGGVTWMNDKITSYGVTTSTNGGRLPKLTFFNPPSNSNVNNVLINSIIPITSGMLNGPGSYGTIVVNSNLINGSSVKLDSLRSKGDTLRQIVSSIVTLSDRILILDKNGKLGVGTSEFSDTLMLTKGIYSTGFTFSSQKIAMPMAVNTKGNYPGLQDVSMAFNESGTAGYIVGLGHQNYLGLDSGTTYLPVVLKSTDNGDTWSNPTQLSIAAKVKSALGVSWDPTCGWELATSVDKNGYLHILTYVSKSLSSFDTLSNGTAYSAMIHIISNGDSIISVKKVGNPYSYRGTIGTLQPQYSDLRPGISRNLTGDKLFFSWFQTDSTKSNSNNKPDWWMGAYDVNSGIYTKAKNMTAGTSAEGGVVFGSAANYVFTTLLPNGTTNYEIPVSFTTINARGNLSTADSVIHKYIQGGIVNSSAFVTGTTITSSTGNSLCSGNTAILTSSAATGNQWYFNGSAITGATSSTYSASNAGIYYTVVSGSTPDTSNRITLTVVSTPSAPNLTSSSLVLCPGKTITLSTTLTAGQSINWIKNGNIVSSSLVSGNFNVDSVGTYTATLTNNGCTSGSSNTIVISAGVKPIASFTTSDTSTCIKGNSISFNNTSTSANAIAWNFGNGQTSTNNSNTKSYSTAGNFQVKLVATSTSGCIDSVIKTIRIIAQDTANVTLNGNTTFCAGDSIRLSSKSNSGNQWLLNNVAISGATAATLIAKNSGNYRLVVTSNGCTDTSSATSITVNAVPSIPTISKNGSTISSSAATGNQWYLNGSAISGATGNSLICTTNGNYQVLVTNGQGCSSISTSILVQLNTAPVISAGGNTTFCQGDSVVLNSSIATGNQWYRNGGLITSSNSNSIIVKQSGNYYSMIGTDTSNHIQVTVNAIPNSPTISALGTTHLCIGNSVDLSIVISSGQTATWYFNGSALGSSSAVITANNAGSYTSTLEENGCISSVSNSISVTVNPYPTASFSVNDSDQCLSGNLVITSDSSTISSGTIQNTWYYNQQSSNAANVSINYSQAGNYIIKLVVSSAFGCSDSTQQNITIFEQPKAGFGLNTTQSCFNGNLFQISDSAQNTSGSLNYVYELGNGFNQTTPSFLYTYPAAGNYTIKQWVTNSNGCIDSTNKNVVVIAQNAINITANGPTTFCDGDSVVLNAITNGSIIQWYQGNNAISNLSSITATQTGNYFAVTSNVGCADTSNTISVVSNALPAIPTISRNGNVLSTNATTGIQWFYNGAAIGGATGNSINANQNGLYSLTVTNAAGCSATSITLNVTGVGTKNFDQKTILVYPNPTSGISWINTQDWKEDGLLTISDMTGRIILHQIVQKNTGLNQISLEKEESGMYSLTIQFKNEAIKSKLVKQ